MTCMTGNRRCQSSLAAGHVTHVSEQVLVHIGEGAKAAISAYHYLVMQ